MLGCALVEYLNNARIHFRPACLQSRFDDVNRGWYRNECWQLILRANDPHGERGFLRFNQKRLWCSFRLYPWRRDTEIQLPTNNGTWTPPVCNHMKVTKNCGNIIILISTKNNIRLPKDSHTWPQNLRTAALDRFFYQEQVHCWVDDFYKHAWV